MGRIIALANQKGGVGKTTTAINLAASLASLERRVLIVDTDAQANASSGLGLEVANLRQTLYECLCAGLPAAEVITPTAVEGLDIIPSHIDLAGADLELLEREGREFVLRGVLAPVVDRYDYIIIDCSPSLGLITVNALVAADAVIIPVQCEYFALEGISKLLNTIKIVKSRLNPRLEIEGFLMTMYDSRTRLNNQIYEEVKNHFQSLVFDTVIQRNVKLGEAPSHGLPALLYDAESRGAINHLQLARELINKHQK
ncbi:MULTISPECIES: ParA family protein [unclassified Porphyromonas]|uniref:ParA family protein n=1 Tax=unclassified Porphyromonas TaxID=2645799 RepID=UPI00052E099C|nr:MULTISPECIES: AAA family ATPase [unclassified Porphyromonas]KGN82276.1 chromosome partitioning protein ParA [Porphyromonas sp. COT-290 OH860]KGO00732.1 chromosome partitioning protein ParA [Porphyromonas sp. COT-290 OH3588]